MNPTSEKKNAGLSYEGYRSQDGVIQATSVSDGIKSYYGKVPIQAGQSPK
jgi:hypothetical protein